jgi:hypothetical protein
MVTSTMRQSTLLAAMLVVLTVAEGCRAVEGIFKAGFWVGLIVAALVVGVVIAIVRSIAS